MSESMDEQTCGKGLAEHSALPQHMGRVIDCLWRVLELHRGAIDTADENGRLEDQAYAALVAQSRGVAAQLQALATQMAGYRDLPAAPHDQSVMADDRNRNAFAGFAEQERELLTYLKGAAERNDAMLQEWEGG